MASYPRTFGRRGSSVGRDIDRLLDGLRRQAVVGLHLGSGGIRIPGLINCDPHDPAADRKLSALDLREFEDGSVDLIETHHMIEHLSFAEVTVALREWARVLRPGGYLVISCPDITRVCLRWLGYSLLDLVIPQTRRLEYTLRMFVGSQEHQGMFHKSAYDSRRMRRVLPEHGFRVEFTYAPYPRRPTPSLLTIARCLPLLPN